MKYRMKIIRNVNELSQELANSKQSGSIGFVPTMGALHDGHISLVEACRKGCATTVVSIFVNPTQFNDPKDLERYPRTENDDIKMLEAVGCDIVFAPSVEEVYPTKDCREFSFGGLDNYMEGPKRPGHFNGVAQVVSRLFEIVKPDKAFFGEKDFQQLAIIRYMVSSLDMGIEIIGCPTSRAEDGLALSSRNALLNTNDRAKAPHIYKTLSMSKELLSSHSVKEAEDWAISEIERVDGMSVEYYTICNATTLTPAKSWQEDGGVVGCVAVRLGGVRLIDNIKYL